MQIFEQALASGQGDMQSVLQASITSLDEAFLADTQVSSLVSTDPSCDKPSILMHIVLTVKAL